MRIQNTLRNFLTKSSKNYPNKYKLLQSLNYQEKQLFNTDTKNIFLKKFEQNLQIIQSDFIFAIANKRGTLPRSSVG